MAQNAVFRKDEIEQFKRKPFKTNVFHYQWNRQKKEVRLWNDLHELSTVERVILESETSFFKWAAAKLLVEIFWHRNDKNGSRFLVICVCLTFKKSVGKSF